MNLCNRSRTWRPSSKRRVASVGLVALLALVSAPLGFEAKEANAAGSFFIAEVNTGLGLPLGYTADYQPGFALGATLGFGGKFTRNPTRFYLIGQFNTAGFSAETVYNGKQRNIDRQVTDVNGGVRMLWPINRNLRVFAEVGFGVAQVDSSAWSPDLPRSIEVRETDSDFALFTGGGVQYRFAYHFSVGGKADFAFIYDEDEIDAVTAFTGDGLGNDGTGRLNLYLTGTFHF